MALLVSACVYLVHLCVMTACNKLLLGVLRNEISKALKYESRCMLMTLRAPYLKSVTRLTMSE
jgi:hypothetical protein